MNATNAGADHERHDPVNVHGQRTMAAGVLMCVPVAAVMAAALVWLERRSVRG